MVAWASFKAQNTERGLLQFYATGLSEVIYNKPIIATGVASAASEVTHNYDHIVES